MDTNTPSQTQALGQEAVTASNARVRLYVPYDQRNEAKAAGARWDKENKTWYATSASLNPILEGFLQEPIPEAHTVPMEQFVSRASVVALENHGRRFEVTFGEYRAFSDAPSALEAAKDVHRAAVNNALYFCENPSAYESLGRPGSPTMPPQKVLADYPQFAERVSALRSARAPGQSTVQAPVEPEPLPAFVVSAPPEQLEQLKAAGAIYIRPLGVYCAPADKQEQLEPWRYSPPSAASSGGSDPQVAFALALQEAGLDVSAPVMDGKLHRCALLDGRRGNLDGAYKGYLDGVPAGFIQNHKTGLKMNWKMDVRSDAPAPSAYERRLLSAHTQLQAAHRAQAMEQSYEQAAHQAQQLWDSARPLEPGQPHPYLTKKMVQAHGLRVTERGDLLIPAHTVDGHISTVQIISKEEPHTKMFLKGGKKSGAFFTLGSLQSGSDYLMAEGYATAASLHEATGKTVVCAFDAGNLEACALALTERYPSSYLCLCADDDRYGTGNPGMEKAQAVAERVGAGLIAPQFVGAHGKPTDFNDMVHEQGASVVRAHVQTLFIDQKLESQARLLAHLRQDHPQLQVDTSKGAGTHTGKVVLKVPGFVVQQCSDGQLVVHEASRLERQPRLNSLCTLSYNEQRRATVSAWAHASTVNPRQPVRTQSPSL